MDRQDRYAPVIYTVDVTPKPRLGCFGFLVLLLAAAVGALGGFFLLVLIATLLRHAQAA